MLKKIFRAASYAVLPIILTSILLLGWTTLDALSSSSNGDNPLKIVIEPVLENQTLVDEEMEEPIDGTYKGYPDLGDDQVFPFVAGLDSYEAMK